MDLICLRVCYHAEATCLCFLHSLPYSSAAEGPGLGVRFSGARFSWDQTFKVPHTSVNKSRLSGTKPDSGISLLLR